WGANNIGYGNDKTASRYYMGALPAAGQWVRLEVPASAVGLEGASIQGMGFSLYDGAATWDNSGKGASAPATTTTTPPTTQADPSTSGSTSSGGLVIVPTSPTTAPAAPTTIDTIWFDDALPAGSSGGATGGDTWLWVASSPSPVSGKVAHQSALRGGLHEHQFNFTSQPLTVVTGDKLFAYVYLDPANLPTEIMLSWCSTNWEHRAYWGANKIGYGTDKTASRYYMGALPAAGQWVRLEIPASAVGLEGATVYGMGFSTYDGRATYDKTGKFVTTSTTTTTTTPTTTTSSGSGTTTTSGSGSTSTTTTSSGSGSTTTTTPPPTTTTTTTTTTPDVVWFDDALPNGASGS